MMDEEIQQKIEKIMSQMECSKGFKCKEAGFKQLCKARNTNLDKYLECLDDNPKLCKFSLSFGYSYFCDCPLRIFIKKELRK